VSPLDRAIKDAQLLEAEFGCEARPCVRRDAPPGVEALLDGGRVRLSGDAEEIRAELLELRDKTAAEMAVGAWLLEEAGHGRRAAALRDDLAVYLASPEDRPGEPGGAGAA
jgi:hypothetical protein